MTEDAHDPQALLFAMAEMDDALTDIIVAVKKEPATTMDLVKDTLAVLYKDEDSDDDEKILWLALLACTAIQHLAAE